MNTRLLPLLVLLLAAFAGARAEDAPALRTQTELETLLGPVALYPDALVALILPAATEPSDVVLAARYLESGGDTEEIERQRWSAPVRALARYPEVLHWMDENLEWTKQIGEAFTNQPAAVMEAIQILRVKARAAGTLRDTTQQVVLVEEGYIRIVPARPDVIFVPRYDSELVYVQRPAFTSDPFLTFGLGFTVGAWLAYDCDWHHRTVWIWHRGSNHRRDHDWRHPRFGDDWHRVPPPECRPWQPDRRRRPGRDADLAVPVVRPHPMPADRRGPRFDPNDPAPSTGRHRPTERPKPAVDRGERPSPAEHVAPTNGRIGRPAYGPKPTAPAPQPAGPPRVAPVAPAENPAAPAPRPSVTRERPASPPPTRFNPPPVSPQVTPAPPRSGTSESRPAPPPSPPRAEGSRNSSGSERAAPRNESPRPQRSKDDP